MIGHVTDHVRAIISCLIWYPDIHASISSKHSMLANLANTECCMDRPGSPRYDLTRTHPFCSVWRKIYSGFESNVSCLRSSQAAQHTWLTDQTFDFVHPLVCPSSVSRLSIGIETSAYTFPNWEYHESE
mmetsp:Transcript_229/g.500  ORF Transcript_229/g.500 Transcript_229/m.500 type:complete len:129 (-) Transcript_229:863-1249(-)